MQVVLEVILAAEGFILALSLASAVCNASARPLHRRDLLSLWRLGASHCQCDSMISIIRGSHPVHPVASAGLIADRRLEQALR